MKKLTEMPAERAVLIAVSTPAATEDKKPQTDEKDTFQ